jgi:hypothetical protein
VVILDSKRRCENVFDLDLYGCDVVYGCDVANRCDVLNIVILYKFAYLNECVEFRCIYRYIIYYVNLLCMFCNFSYAGYSVFYKKNLTQANLRRLGWAVVD